MTEYENDFEDYAETEFVEDLLSGSGVEKGAVLGSMETATEENLAKHSSPSPDLTMTPIKKILLLNEQLDLKVEQIIKLVQQRDIPSDLASNREGNELHLKNIEIKLDRIENVLQMVMGLLSDSSITEETQEKKKPFLKQLQQKFQKNKKNEELMEILVTGFDEQQLEQIQLGLDEGLTMNEIRCYAKKELSAKAMEKIRKIYQKVKKEPEEDEQ